MRKIRTLLSVKALVLKIMLKFMACDAFSEEY
jgi:hypothetical protein